MNITKLAEQIHETAVEKGWWDDERNTQEVYMLIITELSEAVEADREDRLADQYRFEAAEHSYSEDGHDKESSFNLAFDRFIKDTVEDELADTIIRCLDYLYHRSGENIIIPESAGIFSDNFAENIFKICKIITQRDIGMVVRQILILSKSMDIDIEWHIKQKMKYNGMRSKRHGGKKY